MEKREKSERCHSYIKNLAPETARISHPKTPDNTRRQLKTPKNNSWWRRAKNTGTWRRVEMHRSAKKHTHVEMSGGWVWRRKIGGKSGKWGKNSYLARLWRMSGKKSKLRGKRENGREQEGEVLGFSGFFFFFFTFHLDGWDEIFSIKRLKQKGCMIPPEAL